MPPRSRPSARSLPETLPEPLSDPPSSDPRVPTAGVPDRVPEETREAAPAPSRRGTPGSTATRASRSSRSHAASRGATLRRWAPFATAAAVAGLGVAILAAVITGTGYLGGLLTLLTLLACASLAGSALVLRRLQRVGRAAARSERLAVRLRRHLRSERTKRTRQLTRVRTAADRDYRRLSKSVSGLTRRIDGVHGDLNLLRTTTTEIARRQPRSPEPGSGLTDPAVLATMRQTQAMLNLFALGPVKGIVPAMGGWAASPDVVAVLVEELLERRPRLIVECGSGVSTLWLALVIEWYSLPSRIVSLDHDPGYAEQTRRSLARHDVGRHAEVRDAPLTSVGLAGHSTDWYDPAALTDLTDIGLLFVDGPPETTGPLVRWPAVPLLGERLAPTATVVLDDLVRASEQEVAARWAVALPDFTVERLPLQKGAAVFRRGGSEGRDG